MTLNTSKLFFLTSLMLSTLIVISSNSWFSAWMALEINMLSFISLITDSSNMLASEAALKYFLVQALASAFLLLSILLNQIFSKPLHQETLSYLISATLLLKLGAAPFHFWFPSIIDGLTWLNCFILMTWQKIAPLTLLFNLDKNTLLTIAMISSIIVGSLGSFNQLSLQKLMAYSSITHMGWLLAAITINSNLWYIYITVYTLVNSAMISLLSKESSFHMIQILTMNLNPKLKFFLFSNLLSLGGLPPFLGFLPKWLVIQSISISNTTLATFMVIATLATLYVYMRLTFLAYMFIYPYSKWHFKKMLFMLPLFLSTTSIVSLPTMSLIPFHL